MKLRRIILWAGLITIVALIFFSIYGAFLGAERAGNFFNTMPLTVYWFVFAALLIVSIFVFPRLLRKPPLLLIHAGGILIIAGSMFSSQGGHEIQRKFLDRDKIYKGEMVIDEGTDSNSVLVAEETYKELPFTIRLNEFRIEYYDAGSLTVWVDENAVWSGIATLDQPIKLPGKYGTIIPLKKFNNLQVTTVDGKIQIVDAGEPGSNPAIHVLVKRVDGTEKKHYVYENFAAHSSEDAFEMSYRSSISDYISELEVIENGEVVLKKDIEVNDPLYYGGYHFYQSSYVPPELHGQPWATVLSVTSDSGLYVVYTGFIFLCLGVMYHLWIRPIFKNRPIRNL